MNISEFKSTLNEWGRTSVPFLFVVDFEMKKPLAFKLDEVQREHILFDINGFTNAPVEQNVYKTNGRVIEVTHPISLAQYKNKFDSVLHHLEYGDTYLTNLTVESRIRITSSLRDIFFLSQAKYKLFLKNEFLVFSPEIFVQIRKGKIYSYPMKGTIDASVTNAKEKILADKKELAEHVTIVDLIRNDLSTVAENVKVERFRYIDELKTNTKTLYQVSSEIVGTISSGYPERIGDILVSLLPAGSVSGAPKQKTLHVIRAAEESDRGYYTGVFGYFDGKNFDSGVMIRFIEQRRDEFYYRSGGGITTQSNVEAEYKEVMDKVYVPVN